MKYVPHGYQDYVTAMIKDRPATAQWVDMGMGKTVSTMTAFADLMHDDVRISRTLVIAPLRVAKDTWTREASKWDHLQYLKLSRVLGSADERRRALEEPADIYVINRENVPWLVDFYQRDWPFDGVIIDEASSFKNHNSKRFKALRKVRPLIKHIVQLTGTPNPNNLLDLWAQVYLLDRGERLGRTITAFRNEYFLPGRRNGHIIYDWVPRKGAKEAIYEKLSDICYSMRAEDWLTMPDRIDNVIDVHLPDEALRQYLQMERDLIIELGDSEIAALNAAALSNKLLQMANGAAYDDTGRPQLVHDAKLEALDEVIEETDTLLVYYSYRHDRDRILQRYPYARTLDDEKDIADWNAGRIKLLLAHPASSGHGLNLQDGGHVICWFGLPWSLELYQQANARLHRQGQQHSVIIHHIIARNTMDGHVLKVLQAKASGQDALLNALKARIEEVIS
ncbi:MAG: DEAD/DEAH box helicase [Bacillota bacterium]|nr:DEAD/DEAH box helicase [Bacillota bacterium]